MNFISDKRLKLYRFLARRGDAEKIAKKAKVTRGTIYIAVSTGRCSVELEMEIQRFYMNRIDELKKLIDATQNA